MRDHPRRRWHSWRFPVSARTWRMTLTFDELQPRMASPPRPTAPRPLIPAELRAETPGPDGIRQALVAHVRQLIADGVYDSPERWAAAEELLLRRLVDGR